MGHVSKLDRRQRHERMLRQSKNVSKDEPEKKEAAFLLSFGTKKKREDGVMGPTGTFPHESGSDGEKKGSIKSSVIPIQG